METKFPYSTIKIIPKVLILPMRNGNFAQSLSGYVLFLSSYPTYEEWKRSSRTLKLFNKISSYPTYEEWKLISFSVYLDGKNGSYPTYEEWKL